jgi:hypothetical protein
MYLICRDVLCAVGNMGVVLRIRHSIYFLFIYLFVFEVKFYSYPVKQTKSYSTKRKGNNRLPSINLNLYFQSPHYIPPHLHTIYHLTSTLYTTSPAHHIPPHLHTIYHLTCTLYTTSPAQLYYSTASVSLPVPLSAPNRLSRSTISVSNGSPN